MPKAVIFDIDGTLLDSVDQHAESWKEAFEHFGYSFAFRQIRSQIGKGGDKLLENFLTTQEIKQHGKQIKHHRAELFQSKFLMVVKPFPCVRELFEKLRSTGHKVALATSASREEVKKYEQILHIQDLVDPITTKDDVENSKPDPDVLKVVRKLLHGIPASDCVFIGDTPYDVEAAVRDGMPVIGVLCGGFPEEDAAGWHRLDFPRPGRFISALDTELKCGQTTQ